MPDERSLTERGMVEADLLKIAMRNKVIIEKEKEEAQKLGTERSGVVKKGFGT